jgi:hypothetical protein
MCGTAFRATRITLRFIQATAEIWLLKREYCKKTVSYQKCLQKVWFFYTLSLVTRYWNLF